MCGTGTPALTKKYWQKPLSFVISCAHIKCMNWNNCVSLSLSLHHLVPWSFMQQSARSVLGTSVVDELGEVCLACISGVNPAALCLWIACCVSLWCLYFAMNPFHKLLCFNHRAAINLTDATLVHKYELLDKYYCIIIIIIIIIIINHHLVTYHCSVVQYLSEVN